MKAVGAERSSATFGELLARMKSGFSKAAQAVGESRQRCSVAGQTIELRFAGRGCREALYPALSHIEANEDQPANLTILVWESRQSGVRPPYPDWSKTLVDSKGTIQEYSTLGNYAGYIWGVGAGQVLSRSEGIAVYWVDDADEIPYWERSFPFRQLLSWWFQPCPVQPAHAACVAWGENGVLMPGISGSGKSTTTLQLGLAGFAILGDDYILIDTAGAPKVWSLYCTAKLDDCGMARLPTLRDKARRYRPRDEKAVLMWPPAGGSGVMRRSVPLSLILLPKVTREPQSALRPASAGDVVLALAPTTINHLDVDATKVLSMSQRIARSVPAYHLLLGADACVPELIRDALPQ